MYLSPLTRGVHMQRQPTLEEEKPLEKDQRRMSGREGSPPSTISPSAGPSESLPSTETPERARESVFSSLNNAVLQCFRMCHGKSKCSEESLCEVTPTPRILLRKTPRSSNSDGCFLR